MTQAINISYVIQRFTLRDDSQRCTETAPGSSDATTSVRDSGSQAVLVYHVCSVICDL